MAILKNDKEGEANKLSRELKELKDKVEYQKSELADLESKKSTLKKSHQQIALEIASYEEECLKYDGTIKEVRIKVEEQQSVLESKKAHLESLKSTFSFNF